MSIAYIAAPLSAPTHEERLHNLTRARQLRDRIQALGCACYLPHDGIAAKYGYPERDETPSERGEALAECFRVLAELMGAGAELHVLLRPDGTLSPGCAAEVEQVREHWPRAKITHWGQP